MSLLLPLPELDENSSMLAKGVISGFSPNEQAQEIHSGAYCKVKHSEHILGYVIYDAEGRSLVSAGSAKQSWREVISVAPSPVNEVKGNINDWNK